MNIAGLKIRELRKARKIPLKRLADLTKLHPDTIKSFEQGKQEPSLKALYRIAAALGVSLKDILS